MFYFSVTVHVTVQTGARPLGTLDLHEPTVSVQGNRFLLTGLQSGKVRALLLRALLPHETQNFPGFPKGHVPKPRPEGPQILIHQSVTPTGLHPLWSVNLWVSELQSSHSRFLVQDLGCTVLSLHVAVQKTICLVTLSQCGTLAPGVGSRSLHGLSHVTWSCD